MYAELSPYQAFLSIQAQDFIEEKPSCEDNSTLSNS